MTQHSVSHIKGLVANSLANAKKQCDILLSLPAATPQSEASDSKIKHSVGDIEKGAVSGEAIDFDHDSIAGPTASIRIFDIPNAAEKSEVDSVFSSYGGSVFKVNLFPGVRKFVVCIYELLV